ncbi:LysM peptidoglycan-binding domain-containing protein [Aestuariivivens sp. NBU2969]|uniref:PBP1 and LysM peptidoglycan-binding domain-containing protein n=1 Tax=Aestuariivivens sp. NBU2969 TaxID=2873267 RepID=UPI001CBB72A8|nr:LysM peptidoglycan-binding domain-containing protein [Aestuariivivens sp. NBU2969]
MNKLISVLALALLFTVSVKAQNFSTHKVKKGETVEDIAKLYYVTPFDIYSLNPDSKTKLKPNTILIIPISKANKPKITITKELEGFKNHRVKKKETLYSLARQYEITVDEIKKYNTFLYADPLRKGDKLQIPVFKITETVEEANSTSIYKVLPKEGKWRIAYKYGITIKELEALNPDMGEVLQAGQEINVPNIEDEEKKQIDERYSYYEVLPKEGFYRLKVKLGVTQEELEILNPGLSESGLKVGMFLKIPFSETYSILGEESNRINLIDSISDFSQKHIAIMLPFRLNRVDYDSIIGTKNSIKNDPYLKASLDFHSGVLMAVDSLKQLGISLKVDVYDTKNEISEVSRIINNNNFESVDAVIGPLISDNFNRAATELSKYNTPIISPTGSGAKLRLLDNVFQIRTPEELLKDKIISFVKSDTLKSNIVVISDYKNQNIADELKRKFNQAKLVYSRKDKEGKDSFYVIKEDIENVLKPGNNIVFLETQNEGFASNVISILASLIQKENKEEEIKEVSIRLNTTNYNRAFEGDEISNYYLSKLQFHYASGARVYNENDHSLFVKDYEKKYFVVPSNTAVKGFDLTMDVVLRLVSSEDLYASVNKAPLTEYLENKFAYKKKLIGGYYNEAVYLLKHEDLTIVEVRP